MAIPAIGGTEDSPKTVAHGDLALSSLLSISKLPGRVWHLRHSRANATLAPGALVMTALLLLITTTTQPWGLRKGEVVDANSLPHQARAVNMTEGHLCLARVCM